MEKNIKKAFELAEQEVQEKQIENLKQIVKKLLQTKSDKEEEKRKIESDIKIIKTTIDDFKAGRLDKVKEMLEKNPEAKKITPLEIVVVREVYPTKPWTWEYNVNWQSYNNSSLGSGNSLVYNGTGTTTQVFTSGTYNLSGSIINL